MLHHCDNPPCVNPAHLFLGTHSDNMKDMARKGRRDTTGEKNNHAKLREIDVLNIYRLKRKGWNKDRIAARYGVARVTIDKIVYGYNWKHLFDAAIAAAKK